MAVNYSFGINEIKVVKATPNVTCCAVLFVPYFSSRNFSKCLTRFSRKCDPANGASATGKYYPPVPQCEYDVCPFEPSHKRIMPRMSIVPINLKKFLVDFHPEAISPVAISPSKKAIYHLWDIALFQGDRSCTN